MITSIITIMGKILSMNLEQKKNRLVQIKVHQLIREKVSGDSENSVTTEEQIESMAILNTLLSEDINLIQLLDDVNEIAKTKLAE